MTKISRFVIDTTSVSFFSSFVQYIIGGILGSDQFGPGKEGWYLSQGILDGEN